MMSITDPFIEKLVSKDPKIEKKIYETLLKLANNVYLLNFSNTPTWVLSQLYQEAKDEWIKSDVLKHPNCDKKLISEVLRSESSALLHGVVHNPNITPDQLQELKKNNNESLASWANYYLLKDKKEAELFILSEITKLPAKRNFILSHLIRNTKLTQSVLSILINDHIQDEAHHLIGDTVGNLLMGNPHLNPENRAELNSKGIIFKELTSDSEQFLPSSFLFSSHMSNKYVDEDLIKNFQALGHPCGLPSSIGPVAQVEATELNIYQLINSEFLHRMFWRELQGIDGFELTFRNGYRVSDLFIKQEILSKEFDEGDFEEGWKYGGVLQGYVEREWISKDVYLDPGLAPRILESYNTLLETAEYIESFSEIYPVALAYFMDEERGQERRDKFGIQLNQRASELVELTAFEVADLEDLDIDVSFNPYFTEKLSWTNLPITKQSQIYELLVFGFSCKNEKLRLDTEHFLGCMALHPRTPLEIKEKLKSLGNDLISQTLERSV